MSETLDDLHKTIHTIKMNDTAGALSTRLHDDEGLPEDISGYNEVSFNMMDRYKEVVIDDDTTGNVVVDDATLGDVSYEFVSDDTDTAGRYFGEWEVEYGDGDIETFPDSGYLTIEITEDIA